MGEGRGDKGVSDESDARQVSPLGEHRLLTGDHAFYLSTGMYVCFVKIGATGASWTAGPAFDAVGALVVILPAVSWLVRRTTRIVSDDGFFLEQEGCLFGRRLWVRRIGLHRPAAITGVLGGHNHVVELRTADYRFIKLLVLPRKLGADTAELAAACGRIAEFLHIENRGVRQ